MQRELIVARDFPAEAAAFIAALAPRTLALAGGETPRPVYARLVDAPLPWPEIDVFFGDERCVSADDPASNYRMAWTALLARVPARVHPLTGCDPDAAEAELRRVFGAGVPVLDLGTDGHTASLFPGDPALDVTDRLVVRVRRPDHERLSLTLPVLSAAKVALFLVTGAEKRTALASLLAGDIPAARVTAQRIVVIADVAAAGDGAPGQGGQS